MPRRPGADRLGKNRQPVAGRSGLVVDDVVDRRPLVLQREHGCSRSVVEVDPGDDAAAVADDRELPLADQVAPAVVGCTVKPSVAQGDPAEVGDGGLEIGHRGEGLGVFAAGWVERIVLRLHWPAQPGVAVRREALGDESARTDVPGGGDQGVGALRPQPVRPANVLSRLRPNRAPASAVASCTIASGPVSSTAWRTASASSRSTATALAPSHVNRSALPAGVGTDHLVAGSINWGTSRLPRTPLAPATKTRIRSSLSCLWSHPARPAGLLQ